MEAGPVSPEPRVAAAGALGKIGSGDANPALFAIVNDDAQASDLVAAVITAFANVRNVDWRKNYDAIDRIADATGIPLEPWKAEQTADFRAALGINQFASMAHRPAYE